MAPGDPKGRTEKKKVKVKWMLKHKWHEGGRTIENNLALSKEVPDVNPTNGNSIPTYQDNWKKLLQRASGVLNKNIYSMTVHVNKQETTQMFTKRKIMTYPYNEILSISENIYYSCNSNDSHDLNAVKKKKKPALK